MLSNQAKIESLLFVSGSEGISLTEISQLIGLLKPAVHDQILRLNKKYQEDSSCSFEIIEAGERYRLATKKVFSNLLKQYFEAPSMIEISGACLETLSIIAYSLFNDDELFGLFRNQDAFRASGTSKRQR